jgi:hypothetical protein
MRLLRDLEIKTTAFLHLGRVRTTFVGSTARSVAPLLRPAFTPGIGLTRRKTRQRNRSSGFDLRHGNLAPLAGRGRRAKRGGRGELSTSLSIASLRLRQSPSSRPSQLKLDLSDISRGSRPNSGKPEFGCARGERARLRTSRAPSVDLEEFLFTMSNSPHHLSSSRAGPKMVVPGPAHIPGPATHFGEQDRCVLTRIELLLKTPGHARSEYRWRDCAAWPWFETRRTASALPRSSVGRLKKYGGARNCSS